MWLVLMTSNQNLYGAIDGFDCSETVGNLVSFAFNGERPYDKSATSSQLFVTDNNDLSKSSNSEAHTVEGSSESADSNRKIKYTPLEMQFLELKRDYPNAILFLECGYKYRIFGEDAQIASNELGLGCYLNHNFFNVSFPTHRLPVHVRRMVSKGYKVGVVKQTESTALKAAGDNKNMLFTRRLYALYTQSTFIDDIISSQADESTVPSGCLVCISETTSAQKTVVSVVAVNVFAADVFYASFEDSLQRSELENCFSLINPIEFLLPTTSLSIATENLIKNFLEMRNRVGKKLRVERLEDEEFNFTNALQKVSEFWNDLKDEELCSQESVLEVLGIPPPVICCLAPLISYLKEFHLETLLKNFRHFKPLSSSSVYMNLGALTIRNLELTENLCDSQEYGSLLWTVNFTHTKFGKKLLKSWLLKPLKNLLEIETRQAAVEEILHSNSSVWNVVEKMLSKLPDLEMLLSSSFYHRCTCSQFLLMVKALTDVKKCFVGVSERMDLEIEDCSLKNIVIEIIDLLEKVEVFSDSINESSARNEDKTNLFLDEYKYPDILNCKKQIASTEEKLYSLKTEIARILHLPEFRYSTVMGQSFLIEVKNTFLKLVPTEWIKISSTKQVSRFRSPEVNSLCAELQQYSEKLSITCDKAWNSFLDEFAKYFYKYKKAISHLAMLDCFFSLTKVAKQDGYCRPKFVPPPNCEVNIINGRNPILCQLISKRSQYVSNDTKLDGCKRCMIITGPNMGGKSSYVRQVALISVLAQSGCYVPADYALLPVFDSILTRMGSEDDLCCKQSTFMREMQETSAILSSVSSNSLVILDELGRGTSSYDGAAIAHATLNYLIHEVRCITLFVTHYPDIAKNLEETCPDNVTTCHMAFLIGDTGGDLSGNIDEVTFLFSLKQGVASKSYGINVAHLAGIPYEILVKAKEKSEEVERSIRCLRYKRQQPQDPSMFIS